MHYLLGISCFFLVIWFFFSETMFSETKTDTFFQTKFSETKFSETEAETFFPRPNSPKLKQRLYFRDRIFWNRNRDFFPKPSKNWQKARNRKVLKPKYQSLLRPPTLPYLTWLQLTMMVIMICRTIISQNSCNLGSRLVRGGRVPVPHKVILSKTWNFSSMAEIKLSDHLIITEGALRLPTTYDNHPFIHPIQPTRLTYSSKWTKQA